MGDGRGERGERESGRVGDGRRETEREQMTGK
jgi:hypothetical protein